MQSAQMVFLIFIFSWLALAQPATFDSLLKEGLLALDRRDLSVASAKLESAAKLRPADARVWLALAQTYRKSNRTQAAQQAAERATRLGKNDPIILHGLAMFYAESANPGQAAKFESRYAITAPGDRDAWMRAATYYLEAGQPKQAIERANRALAVENRADVHDLLGKAYERDGQPEKAVVELYQAVRLSPYEETYHFDLARTLLLHDNFDAAVGVLESGLKIFDKSAQLELALGIAYYGQRRFPDAVDAFLKTIAMAPEIEQPYVFLGRILDQARDRLPEITAKFAAFTRSNPQNHLGPFVWAKAVMADLAPTGDQERAGQAEALLRMSIALKGQFWETHFELGVLLERQGDFTHAAEELNRAARLNPKDSAVHYRLARLYDRLGKPDQAAVERALHQKCEAEERAAVAKAAGGMKRLDPVIK